MRRNLTTQAGLLTGSRALGQVFNALAGIFVVRALSQYDYGTYRQLILLWTTLFLIGDAGFSQGLYQFLSGRREQAGKYIGQALMVGAGVAVAWALGLVLWAGPVSRFFGNAHLTQHMFILAAYLGLSVLSKAPEAALISLERVGVVAVNTAVFEALKFAMVLGVLAVHGGIAWLFRVMALAAGLKLVHLLWVLRNQINFTPTGTFAAQFEYAMALWLPALLNISGTYAHQYIVGYFFNTMEYAVYSVACFQVPLIGVLSTSINEVLLVRATEYHKANRQADLLKVWWNACRKAQMVFLPATLACIGLARPLLTTLFTARYLSSVPLFIVIVLGLTLNGIFQDSMLRAYEAMRAYAFFYFLRVALAIGLGIAGARWFGLWGAALSTLATLVILNAAQLWKVAELLEVGMSRVLPWRDIGKIGLASGACAILAAGTARLFSWAPAALAAGGIVFSVAYLGIAVRLELVGAEEMREIMDRVRSACSRLGILHAGVSEQVPR